MQNNTICECTKIMRPWGYYETIYGDDYTGYKVKRIVVLPFKRLSLQSHDIRCEHWVIVSGKGKVQLHNESIVVEKDSYVYIPVKALHRIENTEDIPLEFIETQIGSYLGENDITRYEDDYNRV